VELRNAQANQENQRKNLISQNNSSLNEIFYSLQNDFKNIQIELEEKTKTNKKLYEDYQHLLFYLEKEINAVEKMKIEKETYSQSNQDLNDEKNNFGQNMLSLNYSKNEYLKQLDFLTKQNQLLSQQIQEEQNQLNELEKERIKYNTLNKEMQIKNNEKLNIIKINDDAVNYFQQQLNNSNIAINKMVNMINDLENYYKNLQGQYEECSQKHKIYENKKFNNDKIYQELMNGIKKKESDINDNITELDSISSKREQLYNYNTILYNDLDRLQNHIYELVEQNKKLSEKIQKYQQIEEIINNYIRFKNKINDKINNEQNFIEKKNRK
jgi:chromosome segregation ATPase